MNKMKLIKTLILIFLGSSFCFAQEYEVKLTPINVEELGGLQSYSVGTYNGEWLLVGGRLDGLHRRQPFAAFSADGKNQELIVVNPQEGSVWRAALSSLPTNLSEQLSSTNMQFYQNGEDLLCTGGYGYSPTNGDHITFPYLTIIDLPETINDVKNNTLSSSTFQQFENEAFRATGGGLNKIDDVYQLVGGHKFMGRYNPMGPDHGPGFEQEYTNEIRRFRIIEGDVTSVELLDFSHDELHLHRRDYNLVPVLSEGERELMLFSGVFQVTSDLPYLYPISITQDNYEAIEGFTQYYNHYHCANLPIYNPEKENMNTIFFGGIAQFYEEDGALVQDNDVPFVNTIAEVEINKDGDISETRHDVSMPGYLGAGSILILNNSVDLIDDDIIDGSKIGNEFQDVGHIYGGIRSTMANIFWTNTGEQSDASETIYKVSIRTISGVSATTINRPLEYLQFYPNPTSKLVRMAIDVEVASDISILITDSEGKKVSTQIIGKKEVKLGRNYFVLENVNIGYGAFYYTVKIGDKKIARKVIWSE